MPKLNVNAATREELVEKAGLRPDLADAILEFRGRHGGRIAGVDALDELRGVGPATLEQLRAALAFGDRRQRAGDGDDGDEAQEREKGARDTAARTAEVKTAGVKIAEEAAGSAARGGVKVARDAAETGAQTASTAARGGLELVERTAGAMGEAQRETARRSAEGTAELGRLFVELLNEQTRHNLRVAAALGRAVDWDGVIQAQGELVRASFERVSRLNGRYLEIFQGMMRATASAAEGQARKAA